MAATGKGNAPLPPNNVGQRTKALPTQRRARGPTHERSFGRGILEARYYKVGNFTVIRWNSGYLTKYPNFEWILFQQIQKVAQPSNFIRAQGFSNYHSTHPYETLSAWPANATIVWIRQQPEHKPHYQQSP